MQKRVHTQMTAAQKAELLDEESEEEDFEHRPLQLKDLRSRAELSAARRKRRLREGQAKHMGAAPNAAASRSARLSASDSFAGGQESPKSPSAPSRMRSSRQAADESAPVEKEDEVMDDAASDVNGEKARLPSARIEEKTLEGTHEMHETDKGVPPATAPQKLGHVKLVHQAADSGAPAVTEEEIERCFLQRYKMTREELQVMADHMQIHIHNLCFLKQEFDQHDQDQSGYIDARKLKSLLKKLGEDLTEEALDRALKHLDSDGSGEIEFFEFTEWYTSTTHS